MVGKKLKGLSKNSQILCITHLPQIACYADTHYSVYKKFEKAKTRVYIKRLNYDEKIQELSRMLDGKDTSQLSHKHAEELLTRGHVHDKACYRSRTLQGL